MSLSIAINSYKNPELLKLCIDSIKKNIQGEDFEIIVADSATEEPTEMMMREDYPDVKFFPFKDNVGFQVLVKKGIEESRGEYVLLLNSDIIVKENSIQKILEYINNNPDVGMVGPKLLNFNNTLQYSCFNFYKPITILYRRTFLKKFSFARKHLDWFLMRSYDHKNSTDVDWIMGSAMMVSRKAVERVGYMDRQFFMYMEDVDWCRRFWENGLRVVYYPEAVMLHYHRKGSRGGIFSVFFNKLTWVHIFSAMKYFKKYYGRENPRIKLIAKKNDEKK